MNGAAQGPRRLIVISIDDYGDEDEEFTADIGAQVQTVTGWLAAPSLDEGRRFELSQPQQLKCVVELRQFLCKQRLEMADYDESVVLYITGHGLEGRSQRHYLTFAHTERDKLLSTAFPTSELISAVMDSEAEHVLVLVDSCFSGALKEELGRLLRDLRPSRRGLNTLAVITSGDFSQEPERGEFTRLLQLGLDKARDESAGYTASHLSFEEWEKLLNAAGDEHPELLRALWVWPDSRRSEPSLCLPNPSYQPPEQVVGPPRRSVALSASTLHQYWLSRASGRTSDADPGWYFSGRSELMQSLVAFVRSGVGVLVVTGAAGSGKSALLARLVTLSDPHFLKESRFADMALNVPQQLCPPQGAVDAAVLARGKSSLALINDLLEAFALTATGHEPSLQVLLEHLAARSVPSSPDGGQTITVVIDGLDEAQQPMACLSDVVAPLARLRSAMGLPAVRLVLGMRSSVRGYGGDRLQDTAADELLYALRTVLQDGIGEEPVPLEQLRTDGPGTEVDVAGYIRAVLQDHTDSLYRTDNEATAQAASFIARSVAPSFLDARLAAAQLRSAEAIQDLRDTRWQQRLAAGTTALLGDDLEHVARDNDIACEILLAVLRATAFAPGTGLPWAEVWPAVAGAVLGAGTSPVSEREIERAIRTVRHSRLVGYLITGEEDQRVTYRPVHQRVTEALLNEPASLLSDEQLTASSNWTTGVLSDTKQTHRAITNVCANLARQALPLSPHPYVRRHTVTHAAAGHVLNDASVPRELLVQETSRTLRAQLGLPLPTQDRARRHLAAAGLIEPYVNDTVDAASRLDSIDFHLAALEGNHHQDELLPLEDESAPMPGIRSLMQPAWVRWEPSANVVASPRGDVNALCSLLTLDGRMLIAAGTSSGTSVWDTYSGHQLAHLDTGSVWELTVVNGGSGRAFLASAGQRGTAVWDPVSGRQLAALPRTDALGIRVMADGNSRWLLAVLSRRSITVWQPTEGFTRTTELPEDLKNDPRRLPLVCGPEGRKYHVLSRGARYVLWDLSEGTVAWELPKLTATKVRQMAAVPGPQGHDLLAFSSRVEDAPAQLFDPFPIPGRLLGRLSSSPTKRVASVTGHGGEPVLADITTGKVRMWDLSVGRPEQVAVAFVPEQPHVAGAPGPGEVWKLATASNEGVRLWDLIPTLAVDPVPRPPTTEERLDTIPPVDRGMLCAVTSTQDDREWLAVVAGSAVSIVDPYSGLRSRQRTWDTPVKAVLPLVSGMPSAQGPVLAVENHRSIDLWDVCSDALIPGLPHPLLWAKWLPVTLPGNVAGLIVSHASFVRTLNLETRETVVLSEERKRTGFSALHPLPSPDDQCLVAAGTTGRLQIWDAASWQQLADVRLSHSNRVRAICTIAQEDGGDLIAAASLHRIDLWDPRTGRRHRLGTTGTNDMAAVPRAEGNTLLASANNSGLQLWEPRSGRLLRSLLTAAPVTNVACTSTTGGQLLHLGGPAGLATVFLRSDTGASVATDGAFD